MFSLEDKVAIVTGASRGIGRDISLGLARAGAVVTLVSRTEAALQAVKSEIEQAGGTALVCPCDIADAEAVNGVAKKVTETFGGLHILVNNAGMTRDALIMRMSTADWEAPIRTNLTGAFNFIKAVSRPMMKQRWGRIINIASAHALVASPFKSAYVSAKHGLVGLTKTVALEVAQKGITVNAICPGYVLTPLVEKQLADQAKAHGISRERVKNEIMLAPQPTKQFVEVEEVAAMVIYLCGDMARSITGASIAIDGGWTAR